MNRRHFLHTSAASLLASGLWPGALRAAENGQGESGWSFIAVNDLHYENAECGPWMEKVVAAMKASAPGAEFCLLGGDQANQGKAEQFASVREIFSKLGRPLTTTVGNHDWTDEGSRQAYDDVFAGPLNHVEEHRGWQVLTLDTSDGPHYKEISIQPATLAWVDETLPRLSKAKPTLIHTHFPLGTEVKYRPLNADALLERFLEYNLQGTLSGHFHGYTEKTWQHATLTTNRCCSRFRNNHDGTKEKGWLICHVEEGKLRREFVEIPVELRA